jgi:hypothetical protein
MKNKIKYIRSFSIIGIIGIICLLFLAIGLYCRKKKESFSNNGFDVYNNLSFTGIEGQYDGNGYGNGYGNGSDYNASGFGGKWGNDIAKKFVSLQSTNNPDFIFDVNSIQKYVSKDEVKQFLMNDGKWNWSDETKQNYLLYMKNNSLIKSWSSPYFDIHLLQTIYPERAIKNLLEIKNNSERNSITPFDNDDEKNAGMLYEGLDKNGSGIFTFGINSGLLSNCNTCYDVML